MYRKQAAQGIAMAIKFYTEKGYPVFIPVSDVSRYDLIIDTPLGLKRVEVKTTSAKDIPLRTSGGNASWNGEVKRISSQECDIVFCYNIKTLAFKEFDAKDLEGRATIRI